MLAEAPPGDDLKAGLSFRSMGLGRVEPKAAGGQLPTSRLSGDPRRKRIPTPFL
jgi:hypothetical protein